MGRRRINNLHLPFRVYRKGRALYYANPDTGEFMRLGLAAEEEQCLIKLAKIKAGRSDQKVTTVNGLLDMYFARVVPNKSARTQRDNVAESKYLRAFFGDMLVTQVRPHDVANYRDERTAKVRGNREIALLSHAFTRAIEWGVEGLNQNPCAFVTRNKEKPVDRYVDDAELNAFKKSCPEWLRTYVDIKRMCGQRKQTMLMLTIKDSIVTKTKNKKTYKVFRVFMPKTGTTVDFRLSAELEEAINRIPAGQVHFFETQDGRPYSANGFDSIWKRRMTKYVESGGTRFREHDIRGKFATDYEDSGRNPQAALGHKRRSTTDTYIKSKRIIEVDPL